MRPNDSISGALTESSCRLSDRSAFIEFALTLPATGQLQLDVAADGFAPNIIVRDPTGYKIEAGASILKTIERGEYTVVLNAQDAGQLGKFTINSAFQPEANTLCRAITRIGVNQSIAGRLADSSCSLPDNSPHDGYVLGALASGRLDVTLESTDFIGQLILRGDDGRALVSDAKSVSLTVIGDTAYTLIVAGADSAARGAYKVTTTLTPPADAVCRPQKALTASEDASGSIVADSCTSGTDLRVAYFDLTVAEDGLADLRVVPTTEVGTRIDVLDASGNLVAEDVVSGGQNRPIVRRQLSPGFYNVLVAAAQPVEFTLQYRFTPGFPQPCPVTDLRTGVTNGNIDGSSSCRTATLMEDAYRFTLGTPNNLDMQIASNVFNGYLALYDSKDNLLVQNGERIVADLKAGTYFVKAQTLAPGAYRTQPIFTGRNLTCPAVVRLPIDSDFRQRSGSLGTSTCRGVDGQPLDVYEFSTSFPGVVGIFGISQQIDSYITLTDTQGNVLRRDDNSFGGGDAMILQWLPAGTYRVNVTATGGLQAGIYTLFLNLASGERPPGCLPVDLTPGTFQKTLTVTSCQYVDDGFADIYRLSVTEPASLDITMTLSRADVALFLLDAKGNILDAVGDVTTTKLSTPVEAGTYYVVAESFAGFGSAYTLAVK